MRHRETFRGPLDGIPAVPDVHLVSGLRNFAREAVSVVGASRAFVDGDLRIRTERPRTIDLVGSPARSDDPIRRFPVFDPFFDCTNRIEGRRALASEAMTLALSWRRGFAGAKNGDRVANSFEA